MVILKIKDLLDTHYTNDDGKKLNQFILSEFKNQNPVTISFDGITEVNSSFVNSAFIQLLEENYNFDYIRKNLSFSDTNKQINSLILSRFSFEVKRR
ncbi:STAS-like domain-containing protein [Lactococcus lactis]|uniref:STAS-like domain-containing protein n=1 Tax=Lactococcus lactis TaxID=1358 RepID=UPI0024177357|nr:STAS-like domain-containing protein [Lactococcus lactis]MDG4969876.1 STAS-like domain-containing protein [Lactococcus lactis]MDG5103735.1 STAS-like domain-containing protein [Lactococcus lactis]